MNQKEGQCYDPVALLKGYMDDVEYPESDQIKGVNTPEFEKSVGPDSNIITLPDPASATLQKADVAKCLNDRVSSRSFSDEKLSLEELSFLLWATQGIKQRLGGPDTMRCTVKRTVPSAGSRHPFETYVAVLDVEGLDNGIYRYIASKNGVVLHSTPDELSSRIIEGTCGQSFCGKAPVFILWSVLHYRTTWRYPMPFATKIIALDAGHVGQNLHLACEALGLGTCMIGAYDQKIIDNLFELDGKEEFAIYMAPVGKL